MAKNPTRQNGNSTQANNTITSDEVWDLIEPKIGEYWRIAKCVAWILFAVVGTIVGVFSAAIWGLLTNEAIRHAAVRSVINVETLLDDKGGMKALEGHIEDYLKSERLTTLFNPDKTFPSKIKAIQAVDQRFAQEINEVLVTYSFSTAFLMNDVMKQHKLRILKPDRSTAQIDCSAIYVGANAKRNVQILANNWVDLGAIIPYGPHDLDKPNQGRASISMDKDNAVYFQYPKDASQMQTITFSADDSPPIKGNISVDCWITVTVHLQLPKGMALSSAQ
jgi:hypothetical protein